MGWVSWHFRAELASRSDGHWEGALNPWSREGEMTVICVLRGRKFVGTFAQALQVGMMTSGAGPEPMVMRGEAIVLGDRMCGG